MLKGKRLLITGGTGSFGRAVLDGLLDSGVTEIRIFSRDEKKQYEMELQYRGRPVTFYLGDVRDLYSVQQAMRGIDAVFHAAAYKQVPACERFPLEAFKTNVLGTQNVLDAAIAAGVERVVCLSTDKAAYPESAMGISKAMMEKLLMARAREEQNTILCATRYGNVLCSRGSVVMRFIQQLRAGQPLTVTHPDMTRFVMTLEEAVQLTAYALKNGGSGDRFVQKADACTVGTLAQAVLELFGKAAGIQITGMRNGDKPHEVLMTEAECAVAEDLGGFYRIPAAGSAGGVAAEGCCSANVPLLTVEQVKQKLLQTADIRRLLGEQ